MTTKLRIAYVMQNTGIDLTRDVGDAVPVKYTLKGLHKAGYEVNLFELRGSKVTNIKDISKLDTTLDAPLGISKLRLFKLFESGIRRLQRELRLPYFAFFDGFRFYEACYRSLPKYDLCHEHNGLLCVGAALACRQLQIPYILTVSADPFLERALLGKPLRGPQALIATQETKITYNLAKKIICVSEPAKQYLVDTWQVAPEKVVVMPNGVDIELFSPFYKTEPIRAELGLHDEPVIMFTGSFQMWHGLDRLVESFAQVVQEIPKANLLLVGDGEARPVVEEKITELGLENSVIITGVIPHTQVPQMLAIADVVTIPYPQLPEELWFSPLKLYEYMATGKAIVASSAGQIADVIQDGHNGMLVEPGNVGELAQAIIDLLKDSTKRRQLGENARQQAVTRHSWKQYIMQLEKIYLSALNQQEQPDERNPAYSEYIP